MRIVQAFCSALIHGTGSCTGVWASSESESRMSVPGCSSGTPPGYAPAPTEPSNVGESAGQVLGRVFKPRRAKHTPRGSERHAEPGGDKTRRRADARPNELGGSKWEFDEVPPNSSGRDGPLVL